MKLQRLCLIFLLLARTALHSCAQTNDSISHWGASISLQPTQVLATDKYVRKWLKTKNSYSIDVGLIRATLPADNDDYARDYGYPTFSLHLKYTYNHVRLHRDADPDWGQLQPVDYDSKLGNVLSLYATFQRPLLKQHKWQFDYSLSTGVAYAFSPYHTTNNIDNELVGTHLNIYFGAGLHLAYHVHPKWAVQTSLEYFHYSNGAVARPNKGANHFGPTLSLLYTPYYSYQPLSLACSHSLREGVGVGTLYLEPEIGIGMKTLNEDWQHTQFETPHTEPDYRRKHFHLYTSYNASLSLMYRYARRWASGIAADVNYANYASHVEKMDLQQGFDLKHNPWSVGISARHHVFYHQLSLRMALGAYLYRHMGNNAKQVEKPYYETIGLHYTFPKLQNLTIGADIKAHLTKADYLQIALSMPIYLNK